MNKQRKRQLKIIQDKLSELIDMVEVVRDDEQEYNENVPENLQSSDRFNESETALDYLNDIYDSIENSIEQIDEILNT